MAAKKKLTFEERLQQVEALIAKMESGEMPMVRKRAETAPSLSASMRPLTSFPSPSRPL